MLKNEARWLRDQLGALPIEDLSPLLSIGSGTADFRGERQPWIENEVFAPIERRGATVVHHEYVAGAGVDIVGDLSDADFLSSLSGLETRSVLCANVLEHLLDIDKPVKALSDVVAPGGYLIVTVPRAYPYHPDPIDTMFRPSPAEVAALFPEMTSVATAEVPCGTLIGYVFSARGKLTMLRNAVRFARDRSGKGSTNHEPSPAKRQGWLRYVFRPTLISCVVLQRPNGAAARP